MSTFANNTGSALAARHDHRAAGAKSPVLKAYLDFSGALAKGPLNAKLGGADRAGGLREQPLRILPFGPHRHRKKMVGLADGDVISARQATAADPKIKVGLAFARQVVGQHAHVTDQDIDRLRKAGYTDGEIAEIVANVALTIFTNYFNHAAQTEVDFPRVVPGNYEAGRS